MTLDERLRRLGLECRDCLVEARVRAEAIGDYAGPRRRFLIHRAARISPLARGWPLGVLLVDDSGRLRASGATLRAHEPPPILGYPAESARERDELRHAAIRGGFAEGEVVHYRTRIITGESIAAGGDPVSLRAGEPVVRWHPNADLISAIPLERYLWERMDLLIHPPSGAG